MFAKIHGPQLLAGTFPLVLAALLTGCSGASSDLVGPSPTPTPPPVAAPAPPAPPPAPAPAPANNIQRVTVTPTQVRISGSCDHDSIFENDAEGEFSFTFSVEYAGQPPVTVWSVQQSAFAERDTYTISNAKTTFNRTVSAGEGFVTRFTGSEYDGVLGADSGFDRMTDTKSHTYDGDNRWRPATENTIALVGKGSQALCGAVLTYRIDSVPAN